MKNANLNLKLKSNISPASTPLLGKASSNSRPVEGQGGNRISPRVRASRKPVMPGKHEIENRVVEKAEEEAGDAVQGPQLQRQRSNCVAFLKIKRELKGMREYLEAKNQYDRQCRKLAGLVNILKTIAKDAHTLESEIEKALVAAKEDQNSRFRPSKEVIALMKCMDEKLLRKNTPLRLNQAQNAGEWVTELKAYAEALIRIRTKMTTQVINACKGVKAASDFYFKQPVALRIYGKSF